MVFTFRSGGACRELPLECGRPRTLRFSFLDTGKRQNLATAFAGISEFLGLLRTGGRKPRNVVELAPEVKNLFLELHNFAGSQIREP